MGTLYHVRSSEGEYTSTSLKPAIEEVKRLVKLDLKVTIFTSFIESTPSPTSLMIDRVLESFVNTRLTH